MNQSWPPPKKRPSTDDEIKEAILSTYRRSDRPILIGEVAIECCIQLERAEGILDAMVIEGTLRMATTEELWRYGIRYGYVPV